MFYRALSTVLVGLFLFVVWGDVTTHASTLASSTPAPTESTAQQPATSTPSTSTPATATPDPGGIALLRRFEQGSYAQRLPLLIQNRVLITTQEEEAAFQEAAQHRDPFVRRFALLHLGEIANPGGHLVKMFIHALADKDESVRAQAMASLMRQDKAASRLLIDHLKDTRPLGEYSFEAIGESDREITLRVGDLVATVLRGMTEVDIWALVDAYRTAKPSSDR
ncbi:MAG: HEAT repeat domain-containing protein, partial [Magnetococcales bacterium]|nr:HEAT repeat domain-containing protein [Magnetococcales bacterium]